LRLRLVVLLAPLLFGWNTFKHKIEREHWPNGRRSTFQSTKHCFLVDFNVQTSPSPVEKSQGLSVYTHTHTHRLADSRNLIEKMHPQENNHPSHQHPQITVSSTATQQLQHGGPPSKLHHIKTHFNTLTVQHINTSRHQRITRSIQSHQHVNTPTQS
jgi:hypothetical protein